MIRRAHILPMIAAAVMFFAMAPHAYHVSESYAITDEGDPSDSTLKTRDENGDTVGCADKAPDSKGGIMLGRIVPCLVYTIQTSTQQFSQKMIDWLRPLLFSFMIFAMTIFGAKVVQGQPRLHVEGFLLIFKFGLVIFLLDSIPDTIVPNVYQVMAESQQIITGALNTETSSFNCKVEDYTGDNTPRVWAMMDCVMGKLWGFIGGNSTPKTPNMLLGASLFGLASGFLFGGAFGMTVFFGIMGVLISVFMLVIRVALAFINGYLVICLMLILCPLFMPLIFMKVTAGYFQGVIKNIIASFIMPIMVTAYAMLALMMYDAMLFAPNSLLQTLFDAAKITPAMQDPRQACSRPVSGNPTQVREITSDAAANNAFSTVMDNKVMPTLSAANDPCAQAKVPTFKLTDVDSPEYKQGKKTYTALFEQLLELLIMGFLVQKGLATLMSAMIPLSGGGGTVSTLMRSSEEGIKSIDGRLAQMQARATKAFSTKDSAGNTTYSTGSKFLTQARTGISESINAFSGIKK